ncbi:hypothetical protein DRP04_07805, partial [Archaeoglobales archaeon]
TKEKVGEIIELANQANSTIQEARSVIYNEKSKSYDLSKAETLLSKAEDDFKSGNYASAKKLAESAKALALDVDQDGIRNEKDFAPTINNYYIYTGACTLTVTSAVAIKRKREERKRIEELKKRILEEIEELTNR